MRIELAKLLLRRPDVLLLDEPTNHLDIESIQWLENFIATRANLATAYGVGAVCCLLSLFVYIRLVKASYERNKLIS